MAAHLHRLGIAVLVLSGLTGVVSLWQVTNPGAIELQHRDVMLGLLSGTLLLSVLLPTLRLPAIAASVLSKLAFIAVAVATLGSGEAASGQVLLEVLLTAALVATGAMFWREWRQEARWNGVLPLRPEA